MKPRDFVAAILLVLLSACHVGGSGRVSIGVSGPGRGRITMGPEVEAGLTFFRLGAGFAVGTPFGAPNVGYVESGASYPGSMAAAGSFTGGFAVGVGRAAGQRINTGAVWLGRAILTDEPVTDECPGVDRGAWIAELGVRMLGTRIEIFAAPGYRKLWSGCAPRR